MRTLSFIVVLSFTLWGGYWFIGSSAVELGVGKWLTEQNARGDGLTVEYSDLSTVGFPNRFDTTLTEIDLQNTHTGLRWQAPQLRLFALSYKPNHIIAILPKAQTLTLNGAEFNITNEVLKGSVVFRAETALGLDHSSSVLEQLAIFTEDGHSLRIEKGSFATRLINDKTNTHDVYLMLASLVVDRAALDQVDPSGDIPQQINFIKADTSLSFSAPWNRNSTGRNQPKLTQINIKNAELIWGDMTLRARGDLTVDAQGIPSGTLNITIKNWPQVYQIALSLGLIDPTYAEITKSVLTLTSQKSGSGDVIELPLAFANGTISFGAFPLGPAPRL